MFRWVLYKIKEMGLKLIMKIKRGEKKALFGRE